MQSNTLSRVLLSLGEVCVWGVGGACSSGGGHVKGAAQPACTCMYVCEVGGDMCVGGRGHVSVRNSESGLPCNLPRMGTFEGTGQIHVRAPGRSMRARGEGEEQWSMLGGRCGRCPCPIPTPIRVHSCACAASHPSHLPSPPACTAGRARHTAARPRAPLMYATDPYHH